VDGGICVCDTDDGVVCCATFHVTGPDARQTLGNCSSNALKVTSFSHIRRGAAKEIINTRQKVARTTVEKPTRV